MKFNYKNFILASILILLGYSSLFSQNRNGFTVILDAGHGGKDPGNSYHGFVEKNIALKTVLKVGKLLEASPGIKVIYTRTSDVFVELANRPKVANKANANLFVSIHCNAVKNEKPYGTETFVMGLSRHDMNLEVAKAENSVILLENDYQTKYQGFDPKKPESLIGITMMQEENLNSSIALASGIQNNFTKNLKRSSRGVKQQPLWVLDAAYMPSVLIELGFLSNKEEGRFLNSDEGQSKMAQQIASAIVHYKKKYYGEGTVEKEVEKNSVKNNKNTSITSSGVLYKVQLLAGTKKLALIPSNFKGLTDVTQEFENKLYRYLYGACSTIEEARKLQKVAQKAGYTQAFVVKTKN